MNNSQENLFIDSGDSEAKSLVISHRKITFTLRRNTNCFIHAKLMDQNMAEPLTNESYKLRGKNMGTNITGTTNKEGVLYHEPVPDDEYEIECRGCKENIEVYYISDKSEYGVSPCIIRIAGHV